MNELSLLQQREIEARIVGPLFAAFAAEMGEERAAEILAGVIKELARTAGCAAAVACGGNDLVDLRRAVDNWGRNGALSLDILQSDECVLDFNVTRCRYAEMYRRLGLERLGPILSCSRDGSMIEGFNPEIQFQRTQTIMQGASHCDFRYRDRSQPK